jgi:Na+/melibiose symporter-like transporter
MNEAPMDFVTESWRPVTTIVVRDDRARVSSYEFRHWLALSGLICLAIVAPILWLLAGRWAAAVFFGSIGIVMVSIAALLVPPALHSVAHESDEGRLDS